MKRLLLFVLIIMGFCGRFASDAKRCPVAQVVVEPVEPLLVRPVQDDMQCRLWVDSVLDRLSLKERVGQLFIYTIAPHQDKSNRELLRKVIEDYKVGGLLFSGGLMQNQVVLTNEAQRMADIPLLITFDGEWGLSMRLRKLPPRFWWKASYVLSAAHVSRREISLFAKPAIRFLPMVRLWKDWLLLTRVPLPVNLLR